MTNELAKIEKNNNAEKYWPENPQAKRVWDLSFKVWNVWYPWGVYETKEEAIKFANKFNTDKEYRDYVYRMIDWRNKMVRPFEL